MIVYENVEMVVVDLVLLGGGVMLWGCYCCEVEFFFFFFNLTICEQKACRWIYCCHIHGRLRFLGYFFFFFFFLGIWVVFTCLCFFLNVLSSFMPISSYLLVLLQKSSQKFFFFSFTKIIPCQ